MATLALIAGAGGRSPEAARAALLTACRDWPAPPTVVADGPLTLARSADGAAGEHDTGATFCRIEGWLTGGAAGLAAAYEHAPSDPGAVARRGRGEYWGLLWCRPRRAGMIVTDQLGASGPYLARDGGDTVVGTEVRDVLSVLRRRPDVDELAAAHWLSSTIPPPGTTLHAGVRRLPPGHWQPLPAGEPSAYWEPVHRPARRLGAAEAATEVAAALEQAVSRRLAATPRAGLLLSGGLDSGAIAAVAGPRVRAYSVTFPGRESDEAAAIDEVVESLGLPARRLEARGGSAIAGALPYLRAWREPPPSPNLFFWSPLLARAAGDGVSSVLDGEGGDQLFALPAFLLADRLAAGRLPALWRLVRRWPGGGERPTAGQARFRVERFAVRGALPAAAHVAHRRIRGGPAPLPGLRPALARAWRETEESEFAWKRRGGPRWWAWVAEQVTRGAGPVLALEQCRRRAGLAGLAASHPLADVDLVELVLGIDPELSFDRRWSRPLLREAVAGRLPDSVRLRPGKSRLDALFHDLLAGPDLPQAAELLSAPDARLHRFVDLRLAREATPWDRAPEGPGPRAAWAYRLWRMVMLECWLRAEAA
jgi:asparagine synthase (glutamine-hydrolysing)